MAKKKAPPKMMMAEQDMMMPMPKRGRAKIKARRKGAK